MYNAFRWIRGSDIILLGYFLCFSHIYVPQCKVVSLQSSIKKAEVNLQASNMKVERLEEALTELLCQVGDLVSIAQNNSASSEDNQVLHILPIKT